MAKGEKKVENFNMRVSPDFMETIDEWRRHQPDIPPRAEAIRRLVALGMNYESLETMFVEVVQIFAYYMEKGHISGDAIDEFARAIEKLKPTTDELEKLYHSISLPIIPPAEDDALPRPLEDHPESTQTTRPSQRVIGPGAKPRRRMLRGMMKPDKES